MATKDFVEQVRNHQTKHKSSRTDAMRAVVRKDPEAHRAFLKTGKKELISQDDENKDFMSLVDAYQERHGCGKVAAMKVIVRRFPNKHRAYIDSANR
ncbi:hypothetical protein [uncultured Desulfosarcina sp.]|uniref:hypothetical protein n=1 Tax=uncultured Desulfosarcina sp. TaxID=218289 RepID=UPI0029C6F5DF|nr:hypothetical protein [uncultured Desulfosarcina sp.]